MIQLVAPTMGFLLMRNNNGAFQDKTGRWVRFGLGNVSAKVTKKITSVDWIGMCTITGTFTAIEAKRPGWKGPVTDRERAQEKFINLVRKNNGIAGFVTCEEDLRKVLSR